MPERYGNGTARRGSSDYPYAPGGSVYNPNNQSGASSHGVLSPGQSGSIFGAGANPFIPSQGTGSSIPSSVRAPSGPINIPTGGGGEDPLDLSSLFAMFPTGGGGGRGGGGGGKPGIDQATFNGLLGMYNHMQPPGLEFQNLQLNEVNLPEYQGTGFYDFDSGLYDQALAGIEQGIGQATEQGMGAFDNMAAAYGNMQNPYTQGPKEAVQMDPRLMASIEANDGAGAKAAGQTQFEGTQADAAMASVYDLLAGSNNRYQEDLVNSVAGDRNQFQQNMNMAQTGMNTQVNMALAQAQAQYEKDKWQYGESIAQQNHQQNIAQIMHNNGIQNQQAQYNNQGVNSMNMQNVANFLDWMNTTGSNITNLAMAGIDPNTGKQTLQLNNPFQGAAPQVQSLPPQR